MANNTIYIQQRAVPPMCRSRRLRLCGVTPSEAYGITPSLSLAGTASVVAPWRWVYEPGNAPHTAILVERGAWEADPALPYFSRGYNPQSRLYELHAVWLQGMRWHAAEDTTQARPGFGVFGWDFADWFPQLRVDIEVRRNEQEDTWGLYPRVTGFSSEEAINPVGSVPCECGWRADLNGYNYPYFPSWFEQTYQGCWQGIQVGRSELGHSATAHDAGPETTSVTFFMRMQMGGYYTRPLYDRYGQLLVDSTGDVLWEETCMLPSPLCDTLAHRLIDSDGVPLWNEDEAPEPYWVEVSGSTDIKLR